MKSTLEKLIIDEHGIVTHERSGTVVPARALGTPEIIRASEMDSVVNGRHECIPDGATGYITGPPVPVSARVARTSAYIPVQFYGI